MGFCLFNNVAVAAMAALAEPGVSRVLIVDWDVHHGNGTQDIFYDSPQALFFSTHQFPYYPGSGDVREIGAGAGKGYTINVPLPAGVGDRGFTRVYSESLTAVAERFRPDLILVSAGYDAHWDDPLAGLRLSLVFIFYTVTNNVKTQPTEIPLSEVITLSQQGQIDKIELSGDKLTITKKGGSEVVSYKESNANLADLKALGLNTDNMIFQPEDNTGINWGSILLNFLPLILIAVLIYFFFRSARGANNQAMRFGRRHYCRR